MGKTSKEEVIINLNKPQGLYGYFLNEKEIKKLAAEMGIDPALYYIGSGIAGDLANGKPDPNDPFSLRKTVGSLGEIPVYLSEKTVIVANGLISLIQEFADECDVKSLAQTILKGLEIGFLRESRDMSDEQLEKHPWVQGQKMIAQVLIEFLK